MNFGKLFAFALLAGAVAVGGTALAQKAGTLDLAGAQPTLAGEHGDDGREQERRGDDGRAEAGGERLSVVQIARRVSEKGYTDISEIEREDGGYEVTARGRDGRWVELYVDGRTGEVLGSEVE